MKIVEQAKKHTSRIAIFSGGKAYTYASLLEASASIAMQLLRDDKDLLEKRICFLISPSFNYTAVLWGIWRAGGIAVPLCTSHPLTSMKYVLKDSEAEMILVDKEFFDFLEPLARECNIPIQLLNPLRSSETASLPEISTERRAMILYTSGTTSEPKGVVSCHHHIESQIQTLVNAWEWVKDDRILNVLPLHHVHGIINVMLCALWVGGCCEFLPRFDPEKVWTRLVSGELSLFMGVPTMYFQLIKYWELASKKEQKILSEGVAGLRLMVSGSAALPESVLGKWKMISGQILLERYGMTEIGMGLTNPYRGERRAGHVGNPFKGVEIRLVDTHLCDVPVGEPGEILIKGPSVFKEYWRKPEATKEAFTVDGWFKTGDMAVLNQGYYKILGRTSVDIIKSGGYKISALEIEEVLRNHYDIRDCAIVGIPDEEWGEVVAAVLVTEQKELNTDILTTWLKEKLPSYKVPRKYKILVDLPRNVLGKVVKASVKDYFKTESSN